MSRLGARGARLASPSVVVGVDDEDVTRGRCPRLNHVQFPAAKRQCEGARVSHGGHVTGDGLRVRRLAAESAPTTYGTA